MKETTKKSKLLTNATDKSKEVVHLTNYSPKKENIFGAIKENLENEDQAEAEADEKCESPGLAQFSATRWTVRASCFKRIFQNYQSFIKTWKECLQQGGLSTSVKARILGCKANMKTFDYFFGLLLGEQLFSHTDNLSATLQSRKISAVESQKIAGQTVEPFNRVCSEERRGAEKER